jgi:hypothetical protein
MLTLVGRGAEQAELNGSWQAARGGESRVIGLAGAAGIGKTALVSRVPEGGGGTRGGPGGMNWRVPLLPRMVIFTWHLRRLPSGATSRFFHFL